MSYYTVRKTEALKLLMEEIDTLQTKIDEKRPMRSERWQAVTEKLKRSGLTIPMPLKAIH